MLAFRLLGVVSLVCFGGLIATVVLIPTIQSALTSERLQQLVVILILGVASGLLTAIGHLHFTQSLSSTEKAEWRRTFKWGTLFVAGWYLWSVPGRVGVFATKVDAAKYRATGRTGAILIGLALVLAALAVVAPALAITSQLAFPDWVLVRLLQVAGSLIGAVTITAVYGNRWPVMMYVLGPSWLILLWRNWDTSDLGLTLLLANVLVTWITGRVADKLQHLRRGRQRRPSRGLIED
jgi:hypothetical protein